MLICLTQSQLDAIAPITDDGTLTVNTGVLSHLLGEQLGVESPSIAITKVDYDQHDNGTPEPSTRSVRGIAWAPTEQENRSRIWSFISDGLALTTSDEGINLSPVSEDPDLIARAIIAVSDGYPGSTVSEDTGRIEATPAGGKTKKIRVVVVHDARITRPEDVLSDIELIALRAGTLGLALLEPVEGGQALVVKHGC